MVARSRELTPDRSARDLFGSEMRRLRTAAGMSLERLADVLKYGKSSLARFETAEAMIPPDLPAKLDAAFGTDQLFEKLYGLARKEIHPDEFRRRMELESQARLIQEFSGQLVPGLVQTEAYARALFRTFNPKVTPEQAEDLLTARMSRQAVLSGENPPDLNVIIDEGVLHRLLGGPGVVREQLAHLASLTETPNSLLQIFPFELGGYSLMGGSMATFTLDNGSQFVWEESISTGRLLDDQDTVTARLRAYDRLRAYALSPTDSAAMIRSVMEALPE
ncbi:Scr1 family TA system antitoxin-like transcriptional regulator [Streptomyces sp. NPDC051018]|uniref:helix-turn-helix domain-containing protein n=1 Tax=Streptomyces sp. NPDC051018 TaxID=3365639 RepID=UPI0037A58E0F